MVKSKIELAINLGRAMAELRNELRQYIQVKLKAHGINMTFEMLEVMTALWKQDGVNQQDLADQRGPDDEPDATVGRRRQPPPEARHGSGPGHLCVAHELLPFVTSAALPCRIDEFRDTPDTSVDDDARGPWDPQKRYADLTSV